MRYHLPSFRDWVQTLWLFMLNLVWGAVVRQSNGDTYRFLGDHQSLILPWVLTNAFVIPMLIFTYTHWFLWGKKKTGLPSWLPSLRSWGEGLWQWAISWLGLLIPFVVIFLFNLLLMSLSMAGNNAQDIKAFLVDHLDDQMVMAFIFWFLFVGECHLVRRRLTHWWNNHKSQKTKPDNGKQTLPLTVDDELELLKAQIKKKTANGDGLES